MGIKCPKCQTDNPDTQKFCGECATPLPSSKEIPVTETLETPTEKLTRGSTFAGRYQIIEELGKGGMGQVFLALDSVLDRKVAIKFLTKITHEESGAKEQLLKEAKAAAALDHPFICKIYEAGESDKKAFIIMEYIEGINLKEKLEKASLPLKTSLQVAIEIAEALEKAHEKGIIHRDLKPANIMLTPQGHVKVMDFGLAKHDPHKNEMITKTLTKTPVTEAGEIKGTLAYMSPEQARGIEIDSRSDIFSFGVVFFEMLSGQNLFSRPSVAETLSAILRDTPSQPDLKPNKIVPEIDRILRKALAKNPSDRYQNVSGLVLDIRRIQEEVIKERKLFPRRLQAIALGITFIILIGLSSLWFINKGRGPKDVIEKASVSVLISDFDNRTEDTIFDGTLEQAFSIGLEGAPNISVYKRTQARKLAESLNPNASNLLDINVAQLVCRSEGINVVIAGFIEKRDLKFNIKVWALDPVNSERIIEASKTINTKGEVLRATDSLAVIVRSKISGIPKDSVKALAEETFTTSSLEAMKAYVHAQELAVMGKDKEAIEKYKEAINADPDLGRAYSGLAVVYLNHGQLEEAEKYYQLALARIDRMTEREKYRTRGGYYLMIRDYKKAIEEFTSLREEFPGDEAALANLALSHFYSRNMQHAFEIGKEDAELHPKKLQSLYNLAWYAIASGNFEASKLEAQKVLEFNPEFEEVYVCLALTDVAQDQVEEAKKKYRQLELLGIYGATLANLGLADLAHYEGRLSDCSDILEGGIATDLKNSRKYDAAIKYTIQAHSLILQKQKDRAIKYADQAVSLSKNSTILFPSALIYIQGNGRDKALKLATELKSRLNPESQTYAKLIEGELQLSKGNFIEAIKLFSEAQELLDTWLGRFALGRAYLEAKAFTRAYSEFEICLKRLGEAVAVYLDDRSSFRYIPSVYYYLGLAQEGLRSPGAFDSFSKFLKIKKKADPGIPEVEDARKRLAGLKS